MLYLFVPESGLPEKSHRQPLVLAVLTVHVPHLYFTLIPSPWNVQAISVLLSSKLGHWERSWLSDHSCQGSKTTLDKTLSVTLAGY